MEKKNYDFFKVYTEEYSVLMHDHLSNVYIFLKIREPHDIDLKTNSLNC